MYCIRDNLDSMAFSLAGGQILLSFPVTELMSKVRSNCLTEASTFFYINMLYVGTEGCAFISKCNRVLKTLTKQQTNQPQWKMQSSSGVMHG